MFSGNVVLWEGIYIYITPFRQIVVDMVLALYGRQKRECDLAQGFLTGGVYARYFFSPYNMLFSIP